MKKLFEMTQEQLDTILKACERPPMIMLHCGHPSSVQERVNAAWKALGDDMLFDYRTVEPTGEGDRFFKAEEKSL